MLQFQDSYVVAYTVCFSNFPDLLWTLNLLISYHKLDFDQLTLLVQLLLQPLQ